MAGIYKPTYTKTDPLTGKKFKRKLKKWYIKYRNADGEEKKVPGYTDKGATQQLAVQLEREAELGKIGIVNPFERHRKKPLTEHLADFEKHLRDKGDAPNHVEQTADRARRVVDWCGFTFIGDLSPSKIEGFLSDLRGRGRSIQTSNHYLSAIKAFCRWLVTDRRTNDTPIAHLKKLNAETDRRHDRRALTSDEFVALVDSAASGLPIEDILGPDRAMLYILAAWTGLRRRELSSLTLRSLDLDADNPTIRVEAAYSKRRRLDPIPLHPALIERLSAWLTAKGEISPNEPLFPLRTAKGYLRDTAKMMRLDLETARKAWIEDARTPEERAGREKSAHLCYQDDAGLFADFHANRHTFISNLVKAGVSPKVTQTLARHSSMDLTMNVYTHVLPSDQSSAVGDLPSPPKWNGARKPSAEVAQLRPTETADEHVPQHGLPAASPCLSMAFVDGQPVPRYRQSEAKPSDETTVIDADFRGMSAAIGGAETEGRETCYLSTEPKVTGSSPVGCTSQALDDQGLVLFLGLTAIGGGLAARPPACASAQDPTSALAEVIVAWPIRPEHIRLAIKPVVASRNDRTPCSAYHAARGSQACDFLT